MTSTNKDIYRQLGDIKASVGEVKEGVSSLKTDRVEQNRRIEDHGKRVASLDCISRSKFRSFREL